MEKLATLRFEREAQSIISECIKEIRQELEKYDYPRSVSQPIDEFIAHIEKELDKYEEKPPRRKDVEDNKEKLKTVDVNLSEKINQIIDEYGISHDWYHRFLAYTVKLYYFLK